MKLLLVDDEPLARQRLAALLRELGGQDVVGEAGNGREAVEMAEALGAECVLMDIAMPVMDGLEAAHHLAGLPAPPAVVFCTAFDQHALAAFEAAAVDYLVKPVRRERLAEALERSRRQLAAREPTRQLPADAQRRRSHLSARLRGSLRLIPVEDIHYLQAEEKYVVVHHARGEDLIEESLKSLEAEFADRFLRIHRNCLVANDEFAELRRSPDGQVHAILRNSKTPLEVSRRCLPLLRERLKHL
ncbi:LytTR family DNA-binding domain-containing protein [Arenimonas sp.]|uniref:LytR/AlgR family response regulator transcription factor n=1 Tax=Arenimonas sp. TaxID=1872635 RepID=UPI002E3413F3|nr:LytTR family DNA-binding domain-containing protein [Arenimonas sp.]HEX4854077.1 LytTR family DNA-binding domain-containing protein [Arenimonas sp.]